MFVKIGAHIQAKILVNQLECPKDKRTIERVCSYYSDVEINEALKSTLYYSEINKIRKDKLSYFIGTLKRIRANNILAPKTTSKTDLSGNQPFSQLEPIKQLLAKDKQQ